MGIIVLVLNSLLLVSLNTYTFQSRLGDHTTSSVNHFIKLCPVCFCQDKSLLTNAKLSNFSRTFSVASYFFSLPLNSIYLLTNQLMTTFVNEFNALVSKEGACSLTFIINNLHSASNGLYRHLTKR